MLTLTQEKSDKLYDEITEIDIELRKNLDFEQKMELWTKQIKAMKLLKALTRANNLVQAI